MSQLRAPAARPDRREGSGGRHGRPGAGPLPDPGRPHPERAHPVTSSPEARLRPQLLRAAVLPTVVATLGGAAAVLFTVRSADIAPSPPLWIALACSAAIVVTAIVAAALGADRAARSVLDRCHALRRAATRDQNELRTAVDRLRRGERPSVRQTLPPPPGGDALDLLEYEVGRTHEIAVAAAVQASRLSSSVGNEQKVEVFVNLARRLQSLVHREIQLLDELENQVEDPDLLKGLFHVDHLATRVRRHAENLAVLGGAVSRRQWSHPVTMTEVLRSAIAEVEQYPRIKLVPPVDGTLRGHAVADVIHLLAELVENATLFSAPHTSVVLRAQYVTAGLAVEVEDRGLGMPAGEQEKMNALLTDPDQVNVAHLLQDGRIGLYVVAALARRHGIVVRLQSNIYGGVQAVLVIPQGLLGHDPDNPTWSGQPRPADADPSTDSTAPALAAPLPEPPHTPAGPGGVRPSGPRHAAPAPTPTSASTPEPPPATSAARDGRPLLPKRRAQEHIVPQLRGEPVRHSEHDDHALHDPGLMAAFQRGIGLAESMPATEAPPVPPVPGTGYPLAPQRHDEAHKE
ncbi:ATP-binding protein [Streptomyces sp. MUM 203J]|uniref:sensor histidine kinase n=1 Tax=Streptomyces sp. MUM 203J TaxID=2791990 RepID=UPI001F036A27|nr:ATP-binding protein [Streptomyces sp. MUM 203J]MCH0541745.1 ATP-binding protein [Streptomyces sp. MUM 203J]